MASSSSSVAASSSSGSNLTRELGRTTKRQRLGYSRSIGTVNQLLELCQSLTDTRIPPIAASPVKAPSTSSSSPSPLLTSQSPSLAPTSSSSSPAISSSTPGTPGASAAAGGTTAAGWEGPVLAVNDVARLVLGIGRVAKQMAEAKTSLTREFKDMYADINRFGKVIDKAMYNNVDATSSDVFDNRQMNIVMLQQLLRDGRFSVAHTFIKEAGLSEADVPTRAREQFQEVHTIVAALRARDPQPALDWVSKQPVSSSTPSSAAAATAPTTSSGNQSGIGGNQSTALHALSFSLHRLSFLMILLPPSLFPPASTTPVPSSSSSSPYNTPPHGTATTGAAAVPTTVPLALRSPSLLSSPLAPSSITAGSTPTTPLLTSSGSSGNITASPLVQPSTPVSSSLAVASPPLSPLPSPHMSSSTMSPFLSPLMLPSMPSIHHSGLGSNSGVSGIPSFSLSSSGTPSTWPRAISFGPPSAVSSPARPILANINSRGSGSGVSLTPISLASSSGAIALSKEKSLADKLAAAAAATTTDKDAGVSPSRASLSVSDSPAERLARTRAAMLYAQRHFAPFAVTHAADIGRLMTCLMFTSDLLHSPYADLLQRFTSHVPPSTAATPKASSSAAAAAFAPGPAPSSLPASYNGISLWKEAELQFTTYFYRHMGLPSQSPLITTLHASDEALPKSLKFHALMADNANNRGLMAHPNSQQLVDIELGKHLQYHSTFVCPIAKTQCSDDNPPVLLRCGHVISRDAVDKITKTMRSNRFKCPTCPREQTAAETLTLTL